MGTYTTHGYFYKPDYGEKGPVDYYKFNAALDALDALIYPIISGYLSSTDNVLILISDIPTYSDASTFTLPGDYTARFVVGYVVQAQVASGMVYSTVEGSVHDAGVTTITLTDAVLTDPITRVYVFTSVGIYTPPPDVEPPPDDLPVYLMTDTFTTDRTAGNVNGTAAEPGDGTRHIVDGGGGEFSIGTGHLNWTGQNSSPAIGKLAIDYGARTRATGLMFQVDYSGGATSMLGFSNALPITATSIRGAMLVAGNHYIFGQPSIINPKTPGSTYHFICRSVSYCVLTSTAGGDYKLWWVDKNANYNAATIYPALAPYDTVGYVDNWNVIQLVSPWNTDYGPCTSHQDAPVSGATQTSTADGIIECDWYPLDGEILELSTRMSDLDNRWIVRCDHSGGANTNTIKLIERNAGSETERGSAASTWVTGTRVRVAIIQDGTMIKAVAQNYNTAPVVKITYTVADSFNLTAIGTMVSGGVILYNFSSYPRTYTSLTAAPTQGVTPAQHTITLTSPTPYKNYQRSGTTGSITIAGIFNEPGTHTVEASFNGGAYADVATNVVSRVPFTGTLTGQAQGQGTLTVRIKDVTTTAITVPYVGIGDIYLVAGQSNAVGQGVNNQVYSHASLKATRFGKDYRWKDFKDPFCEILDCADSIYAADYGKGSFWPLVSTAIMAETGVPVSFIPACRSGALIEDWAVGANHQDRTTYYGCAVYRVMQAGGGIKAVLWMQGETATNTEADYKTRLEAIANAFHTDLGVKTMPCKLHIVGNAGDTLRQQTIRAAVADAWADAGNILIGPDLSGLTADDAGVWYHLTSDVNVAAAATLWADRIIAEFY
jgi:hypothetical protein